MEIIENLNFDFTWKLWTWGRNQQQITEIQKKGVLPKKDFFDKIELCIDNKYFKIFYILSNVGTNEIKGRIKLLNEIKSFKIALTYPFIRIWDDILSRVSYENYFISNETIKSIKVSSYFLTGFVEINSFANENLNTLEKNKLWYAMSNLLFSFFDKINIIILI